MSVVSIHYFRNKRFNFNSRLSVLFFRRDYSCRIRLPMNKAATLFFWVVSFRHSLTLDICWCSSLSMLSSIFRTHFWQRGSRKLVSSTCFFWGVSFRHSLTLALCWNKSLLWLGSLTFFEVLYLGLCNTVVWQRGSRKLVSSTFLYSTDSGAWHSLTMFLRLLSVGWLPTPATRCSIWLKYFRPSAIVCHFILFLF